MSIAQHVPDRPPSMVPPAAAIRSHIAWLANELRESKTLLRTVERIEAKRAADRPLPLFPEPDMGGAGLEPVGRPDPDPTWVMTVDQCRSCKAIATVYGGKAGERRCFHCGNAWTADDATTARLPGDGSEGQP